MRRSSKTLAPAPAPAPTPAPPCLPAPRRPHLRRRVRSPGLPRAAASSGGGRRSGPTTPLLRWKFDDAAEPPPSKPRRKKRNAAVEAAPDVSARRLLAGLWHLHLPEPGAGAGAERFGGGTTRLGSEHVAGHLRAPYVCNPSGAGLHSRKKNDLASHLPINHPENGISHKLEASAAVSNCAMERVSNCAMERATKWDPGYSKASDEIHHFYGHLKLFEDQQVTNLSVVSALQTELEQARARNTELEAERRSAKKKLDHLLRTLAEEKAAWRSREHEKIRAIIDDVKADLNRERKTRQRMEIVNSKLVNELAEVKLSAKRFLQDYEKERKARELMEEVCDELAKEIGEDKAEVEALKRESMKIREEIEEERKMLQMAEVWREERVQMKLIDAKLTLDEKYSQLNKVQADLEAFLGSQTNANPSTEEIREAELLREAVSSVKVQDIKEFTYQPPPASEDIYSIFEELQPREPNERDIEPCYGYSPASRASKIHSESPDINDFLENPSKKYVNGMIGRNVDDDDSGWETVSHVEEQGSSNSPEGSDPSVNGHCQQSNASVSGTDWEENGDNDRANSEISEVCSVGTKQSRKKASSISRLWRSSCPNNGENYKKITVEAANGRLSNGRISNATLSPDGRSGDVCLSPQSLAQWSSPDSVNPHITRGMKGCIEWPRGMQKHSLKAKLLEARMESQKIQLRHVLKQKI